MHKNIIMVFLLLVLMIPGICFADTEYDDGTILNDKEETVYETMVSTANYFYNPSTIRLYGAYNLSPNFIEFTVSAQDKNSQGSNGSYAIPQYSLTTIVLKGRKISTFDGPPRNVHTGDEFVKDKDVDTDKVNHVWEMNH